MNKKKTKTMLLLVIIILGITIGYAVLSSNLNISGTSIINKPTWDIHFENIQVKSGSVTPNNAANITNATTVTYSVIFDTPGQFYEFNVDVKNAGTIDGMIETVTSTVNGQPISNLPSYVEYYVTYEDGHEIQNNQLLAAGSKETYTVHIGFSKDINLEDLPNIAETYNITLNVTDTQATTEAIPVDHSIVVYSRNERSKQIVYGQPLPQGTAEITDIESQSTPFIKSVIRNGIVDEVYVVRYVSELEASRSNGQYNAGIYYLRGWVYERNSSEQPIYTQNRAVINQIFNNPLACTSYSDNDCWYKGSTEIKVDPWGTVSIGPHSNRGWLCIAHSDLYSYCEYRD